MAKKTPSAAERPYSELSDLQRLHYLLGKAGLGQDGAARELGIDDRVMRDYCAGDRAVPRIVMLALERLIDMQHELT